MYDIELRHLRCLVTLAEERNFGRAAARLHMSQPPLTRLLSEVERTLGVKLFERTTRRVAVTPVGEIFIAEAQDVLARADAARDTIHAAIRRQAGQVRLAYTSLALQTVLPRLLSAFRAREHDARVDLVELSGDSLHNALRNGQVDVAFSSEPFADAAFANVLLHRQPLSLLVPDTHPLAAHPVVSLGDLASDTLILHPRHEYPDYYDRVLANLQAASWLPQIYHREPGQNCVALVVGGKGILLTSGIHTGTPPPGLRLVTLEPEARLHEELWGIWPRDGLSRPASVLTALLQSQAVAP